MGGLKREIGRKGPPRKEILIVCEGSKTEPNYFKAFRVSSVKLTTEGTGKNTESLVQHAIDLMSKRRDDPYDEVWCVFDRDSFPSELFNKALVLAANNNINLAYSNEAFEIWYLLHFNFCDTAFSRHQYSEKLREQMGSAYKKNDPGMYNKLLSKQPQAIKNAKKLMERYDPHNPEKDNPCTTVFKLVEELNNYIK